MLRLGRKRKLRHFAEADSATLEALKSSHKDEQELFQAYYRIIIEGIDEDLDNQNIWADLTKPQQVLATLGVLTSQINNGGVWQFLFNRPELSVVAGEALDESHRLSTLLSKYKNVLREFAAMTRDGTWAALMESLEKAGLSTPEGWKLFKSGAEAIPSSSEFDEVFFEKKKRTRMYAAFNKYIDHNLDKLIKIKKSDGSKAKAANSSTKAGPAKKKDAVPYFSLYLEAEFGEAPQEVSVYYTGKVNIDSKPAQLFLMKYKLSDGFEGVGITGHFTLHLPELPWAEVMKMRKQHHKPKLVNLFYGAYLVNKARAEDPSNGEIDDALWETFRTKVQSSTGGQIPVNVVLKDYIKIGDYELVVYTGDLRYYRNNAEPPADPQNVSTDKKDGFDGEVGMVFHADPKSDTFGGRGRLNDPVVGRFKLYHAVGSKFKLLKDNPWGY